MENKDLNVLDNTELLSLLNLVKHRMEALHKDFIINREMMKNSEAYQNCQAIYNKLNNIIDSRLSEYVKNNK